MMKKIISVDTADKVSFKLSSVIMEIKDIFKRIIVLYPYFSNRLLRLITTNFIFQKSPLFLNFFVIQRSLHISLKHLAKTIIWLISDNRMYLLGFFSMESLEKINKWQLLCNLWAIYLVSRGKGEEGWLRTLTALEWWTISFFSGRNMTCAKN